MAIGTASRGQRLAPLRVPAIEEILPDFAPIVTPRRLSDFGHCQLSRNIPAGRYGGLPIHHQMSDWRP